MDLSWSCANHHQQWVKHLKHFKISPWHQIPSFKWQPSLIIQDGCHSWDWYAVNYSPPPLFKFEVFRNFQVFPRFGSQPPCMGAAREFTCTVIHVWIHVHGKIPVRATWVKLSLLDIFEVVGKKFSLTVAHLFCNLTLEQTENKFPRVALSDTHTLQILVGMLTTRFILQKHATSL